MPKVIDYDPFKLFYTFNQLVMPKYEHIKYKQTSMILKVKKDQNKALKNELELMSQALEDLILEKDEQ